MYKIKTVTLSCISKYIYIFVYIKIHLLLFPLSSQDADILEDPEIFMRFKKEVLKELAQKILEAQ